MRVKCEIEETDFLDKDGRSISGTVAKGSRRGHQTKSFGASPASFRNCLALMLKECPKGEKNIYVP